MEIEVIAIGNEVLSGFTINSNAAFISQELLKVGLRATRHTVLPDDPSHLRKGLREAMQRSQLIITTGGLGPTLDDISRNIAAELFHSDFRYDASIAEDLKQRYGPQLASITDQATVPTKAFILKNTCGTAPGFIFNRDGTTLIMLPGVPPEMKTMWANGVVLYLQKHFSSAKKYYCRCLNLFETSEPTADVVLRKLEKEHPNVEFGVYVSLGTLSIHLTALAEHEAAADSLLQPPLQALRVEFASFLYDAPSGKIEEAVHDYFIRNGMTLTAAESCTGGALAARLTAFPGASQYFLGSVVAYSNQLKMDFLSVPEALLQEKGAVSEEVVKAMVEGLLLRTGSDYGIAITGIAGPTGGTPEKPVGTVWYAVGRRGEAPVAWLLKARGNREMIAARGVNAALSKLLQLAKKAPYAKAN